MLAFGNEEIGAALLFGEGEYAVRAVSEQVNRTLDDFAALLDTTDYCCEFSSVVSLFARDSTAKTSLSAEVVVQLESLAGASVFKGAVREEIRAGGDVVVLICIIGEYIVWDGVGLVDLPIDKCFRSG